MAARSDYKQDLIVSIRYKNDLPPPPMPPKLLDIDTGGLQQYLDPGFAASIAKREEPNIETDAEGGMPIDVIGMYGYFDGDESSIMAPEVAPPLDPEDEILMLTPDQLRAGGITQASNFLRKTQYMTAAAGPANELMRGTQPRIRKDSKPKPQAMARDDTENIKRNIQKAFDLAYPSSKTTDTVSAAITQQEKQAWDRPVHPDKKTLKPLAFYPVLPDFDASTLIGPSWNLLRFDKPPLPALKGHRDNRIDAAFLYSEDHPERKKAWEAAKAAYDAKPAEYNDPGNPPAVWHLLLPREQGTTPILRKMMNTRDPEHDDPSLMARIGESQKDKETGISGELRVPLEQARFYPDARSENKPVGRHTRTVVMTLKEKDATSSAAAHYYPIGQVNLLYPDRAKLGQQQRRADADEIRLDEGAVDQVLLAPRDPDAAQLYNRYYTRPDFDPTYGDELARILEMAEADQVPDEAEGNTANGADELSGHIENGLAEETSAKADDELQTEGVQQTEDVEMGDT